MKISKRQQLILEMFKTLDITPPQIEQLKMNDSIDESGANGYWDYCYWLADEFINGNENNNVKIDILAELIYTLTKQIK